MLLGNDIVDLSLNLPLQKAQRPGFLTKVCTASELLYFRATPQPERLLWRIWSMKEAAFKAAMQAGLPRRFAPKKLQVKLIDEQHGQVQTPVGNFWLRSKVASSYVHSVACSVSDLCWQEQVLPLCGSLPAQQSSEVRQSLFQYYARQHQLEVTALCLRKRAGVPKLWQGSSPLGLAVSLAHHGRRAAWVYAPKSA